MAEYVQRRSTVHAAKISCCCGYTPHAAKIFLPSLGDLLRGTLAADVNALSLLRVAHRFDMPPLEEMCQGILIDGFQVGTVAEILEVADTLNCKALRAACMDFVVAYAPPKGLTQKVLFSAPCSPSIVGATT